MTMRRPETVSRLSVLLFWGVSAMLAIVALVWVLLGLQPKPLLVNKAGFLAGGLR